MSDAKIRVSGSKLVLIARVEWIRHHREYRESRARNWLRTSLLLTVTAGLGSAGYATGQALASREGTSPEVLGVIASVVFVWMVWRCSVLTYTRFERLNPDFLLTSVPANVASLGLFLVVYARVMATMAFPTIGVAVGTALGMRSPVVALTIPIAIGGMAALATGIGSAGRLTIHYLGRRLTRGGFYRDLLVVFGWIPLLGGWLLLQEASVTVMTFVAWLEFQPISWVVDLALLGAGERVDVGIGRSVIVLGGLLLGVGLLVNVTTALARRIWETEPASSTGARSSHTLVGEGRIERFVSTHVSRPVLTVARKRWLMERRTLRGVLYTGYVLLFVGVIVLPTVGLVGGPPLVLLAFTGGLATGVAFGTDPIGIEYRVVPLLLTTIDGRQFVDGVLMAALSAGVPAVTVMVLPVALLSPAGLGETIGVVLVGVVVCACTTTVGVAAGLGVEYDEFVPVPTFFTDAPGYGVIGWRPFLRLAALFGIVLLATLPAFLGNLPAVYGNASALGVPTDVVRLASLVLAALLATLVSAAAYRIAVRRYQAYQIE